MRPALKLSPIEREHLQEVYNGIAVARDDLPYTEAFDRLCQEFQDRTFKNAEPEQVYGALLKYSRTGSLSLAEAAPSQLSEDHAKQLKVILSRFGPKAKLLPYSEEVDSCRTEFQKLTQCELTPAEFWAELRNATGAKRRPPKKAAKVAVAAEESDDDDSGDE